MERINVAIFDIETTGLNPVKDKIISIAIVPIKIENGIVFSPSLDELVTNSEKYIKYGDNEKEILEWFWDTLRTNKISVIIGFNSDDFDWQFIKVRSFVNGVPIIYYHKAVTKYRDHMPAIFKEDKLRYDLRYILNNTYRATGKLQEYAELAGIDGHDGSNGSEIPVLYEAKDWEAIKMHNLYDAYITMRIFLRMLELNFLPEICKGGEVNEEEKNGASGEPESNSKDV